jgi:hypothetical protein
MSIEVKLTGETELEAVIIGAPERVRAALYKKMTVIGLKLQAKMVRKLSGEVVNVVTGNLRRSIFMAGPTWSDDTISVVVGSSGDVKYAAPIEYGSAAHDIVPTKAKALHFMWGGQERFFKRVHIPAQPARSFIRSSLAEMQGDIDAELTEAVAEGLAGKT